MEDTDIVLLKFTFSNLELSPATQVPSNRGKWSAIPFASKPKTFYNTKCTCIRKWRKLCCRIYFARKNMLVQKCICMD